MGVWGCMANGKKAGEFVSFGSVDQSFDVFRFITDGDSPSAVAASRMFSTAAHAEAK